MEKSKYYPMWIKSSAGVDCIVSSPAQHAALVGYPVNDDGTPAGTPVAVVDDPLGMFDEPKE